MSDDRPDLGVRHRTRPTVGEQPDPIERMVRVLGPILPGSLIVMDQNALGFPHDDDAQLTGVLEAIGEVVGHRRWLVIIVPDAGAVHVLGPGEVSSRFRDVLADLAGDVEVVTARDIYGTQIVTYPR